MKNNVQLILSYLKLIPSTIDDQDNKAWFIQEALLQWYQRFTRKDYYTSTYEKLMIRKIINIVKELEKEFE